MTPSPFVSAAGEGPAAVPGCDGDSTSLCATVDETPKVGSQGYARVVIDLPAAHDTDLQRSRVVMQQERVVAEGLRAPAPLLGSVSAAGAGTR